jgi:hypothetical protein
LLAVSWYSPLLFGLTVGALRTSFSTLSAGMAFRRCISVPGSMPNCLAVAAIAGRALWSSLLS